MNEAEQRVDDWRTVGNRGVDVDSVRRQAGLSEPPPEGPVLSIRELSVSFRTDRGIVQAADGLSFDVYPNTTVGVVGESGSGKTISMLAALGLVGSENVHSISGQVWFQGRDLLAIAPSERRRLLGQDICMVFQDPMSSLNPVMRVGQQIAEVILAHSGCSRAQAEQRAVDLLSRVGVPDAAARARQYPHEFSGGMRQRAMVAIAIANEPKVLIADEPTTALDVTVQAQLLDLLRTLQEETGAATIFITHDMGVVAELADRVVVMYGGRIMEEGPVADVLVDPRHPYTAALLRCLPGAIDAGQPLIPIPGQPPDLTGLGDSCPFAPRCELARSDCESQRPPLARIDSGAWRSACLHHDEVPSWRTERRAAEPTPFPLVASGTESRDAMAADRPLLEVQRLVTHFPIRSGVLRRQVGTIQAVDGIDLRIAPGEALGVVGESGCGKTTVARSILRLVEPTSGLIEFDNTNVTDISQRALRRLRRRFQIVFQDPYSSLNPRLDAGANVAEPLRILGMPPRQREPRVRELLADVGIRPEHAHRFPAELSGGQRQRVGIARALAPEPKLLVLDEPISSLDASVQAQVLNLLLKLRYEHGLAYLFISHDLAVVRHLCDRVSVMYLGRIVEQGAVEDIYLRPAHPYTQALLSASPRPDPTRIAERPRIVLEGDPPSPANPPSGCRFRTRCWKATEKCAEEDPQLVPREGAGPQSVACHYAETLELEELTT